jgi:hypothetical protein
MIRNVIPMEIPGGNNIRRGIERGCTEYDIHWDIGQRYTEIIYFALRWTRMNIISNHNCVGLRCSNKCDIHLNIGQGYTEIRHPPLSWTIEYRNPIFTTVLDNGVQKYNCNWYIGEYHYKLEIHIAHPVQDINWTIVYRSMFSIRILYWYTIQSS